MKAISLVLLSLVTFTSFSAHAIVRPGWERPILNAPLTEVDADGHGLRAQPKISLTETRQDGARAATGFVLNETVTIYCITAPCPPPRTYTRRFHVDRSHLVGPNRIAYEATEVVLNSTMRRHPRPASHLRVIENAEVSYWNVKLEEKASGPRNRYFEGKYNPVYTIQGAGEASDIQ